MKAIRKVKSREWSRATAFGTIFGLLLGLILWIVIAFVVRDVILGGNRHVSNGWTTAEVERDVSDRPRRNGEVRDVSCRQITSSAWNCSVHLASGEVEETHEVWYKAANELGTSVLHRYRP
jgi:hypothetical protein